MSKSVMNPLRAFQKFRKDEDGMTAVVEAMICVPVVLSAIMFSYYFFDLYKTKSLDNKANYAVADAVSRETGNITGPFVDSLHNLHKYVSGTDRGSMVRVHSVTYLGSDNYRWAWTEERNDFAADVDVADSDSGLLSREQLQEHIPTLAVGESVIVVETYVPTPGLLPMYNRFSSTNVSLLPPVFSTVSVTSPRFSPQVCWSEISPDSEDKTC